MCGSACATIRQSLSHTPILPPFVATFVGHFVGHFVEISSPISTKFPTKFPTKFGNIGSEALRPLPDMHPSMHMGRAPEIPKHRRTFQLPDVPHTVVANVFVLVERHVQMIEAVLFD